VKVTIYKLPEEFGHLELLTLRNKSSPTIGIVISTNKNESERYKIQPKGKILKNIK